MGVVALLLDDGVCAKMLAATLAQQQCCHLAIGARRHDFR
jgi:hypothetical protein